MVCVQERIKLRRNKILKKVRNLSELVDVVGKDTVNKCFAEYIMLMIARNNKLEELENDLEDRKDTDMMTVAEIKSRLE